MKRGIKMLLELRAGRKKYSPQAKVGRDMAPASIIKRPGNYDQLFRGPVEITSIDDVTSYSWLARADPTILVPGRKECLPETIFELMSGRYSTSLEATTVRTDPDSGSSAL
jgi:hypothetical protein